MQLNIISWEQFEIVSYLHKLNYDHYFTFYHLHITVTDTRKHTEKNLKKEHKQL